MGFSKSLKAFYRLTKPGIIYGNALTAAAGYLLAAKDHVELYRLAATLLGIALVIGSACVFNNYFDRGIDRLMARTSKRSLPTGEIKPRSALIFAFCLGIVGTAILVRYTNRLTVVIGLLALLFYVVFYGIAKRRSVHGTIIGSVPGAASIVAGYTTVTDRLDSGALILFLILVFWQMPHFYAIALYRIDDYRAAKLPVLPVRKGAFITKLQISAYVTAFILACAALRLFDYAGDAYLVVVGAAGLTWLWRGLQGFKTKDNKLWARQMFFLSLLVNLTLSLMLVTNAWWAKL